MVQSVDYSLESFLKTSNSQKQSYTVLLVDDDQDLRRVLGGILEEEGYTVVQAEDGQQAITLLFNVTPDLIISDIQMPKMDGFEFFRRLERNDKWSGIPVIFVSGYNDFESYKKSKELGVDDFISKPVDIVLLLSIMKGRLRRATQIKNAVTNEVDSTKKKLLHLFSHELRTPLTHIKGVADILLDDTVVFDDDSLKKFYEILRDGTDRLQTLMEEFLTVARIEAGYAANEARNFRSLIDLTRILDDIKLYYADKAIKKKITFIKEIPSSPVYVLSCEIQIREILRRLMDNAIFYTPKDGVIRMQLQGEGGEVEVSVRDTGPGIEESEQESIFEKYFQSGRNQIEQQGIGLGLYIARSFAEFNGGSLTVQSTPNVGSRFILRLTR